VGDYRLGSQSEHLKAHRSSEPHNNERTHCPDLGFSIPFSNKRNWNSSGKYLLPELGQGKYK
jgi:hypothetical protein